MTGIPDEKCLGPDEKSLGPDEKNLGPDEKNRGPNKNDGRAVPSRRLSRFMGLSGMAVNIAGGIAANGVKQIATGKRPKVSDLFLTPKNALKLTRQLSEMRGAAMKIGQMISMDSGDFLPKEFADILAHLRADAQHMPRKQLNEVLFAEWGDGWSSRFEHFQHHPIAAASIGQVHRAILPDGEDLAIKVQYPGVKESIDSDVKNVASLLKLSGVVPSNLDVKPIIEEGRLQLHQEADYEREANYLRRFGELLSGDPDFLIPEFYEALSTDKILAMSFLKGRPIEEMVDASQETRNQIVSLLISLTLREIFEFKLMQTDPNFANYKYDEDSGQIILLDFGASREIADALSNSYRDLMLACLTGDTERILQQTIKMGFIPENMPKGPRQIIAEMIAKSVEPLSRDEPFDFGESQLAGELSAQGFELAGQRDLWHVPPPETVFIQRKLGGMYMLASRLRAKVNVSALMRDYIPI